MAHHQRYRRRRTPGPDLGKVDWRAEMAGQANADYLFIRASNGQRHFVKRWGEPGTDPTNPDWRPYCTVETDEFGVPLENGVIQGEVRGYMRKGAVMPGDDVPPVR